MNNIIKKARDSTIDIKYVKGIILFKKNKEIWSLLCIKKEEQLEISIEEQTVNNIILYNVFFNLIKTNIISLSDLEQTLTIMKEIINNIHMYCIGCFEKVEFQADTFVTCGKPSCINKYEEMQIGNPVSELIKKDTTLFEFLVESGFQAILSNRNNNIFEPFPPHFLLDKEIGKKMQKTRGEMSKLKGENYDKFKDFKKLQELAKIKVKSLLSDEINELDDSQLCNLWSLDMYMLVRFIITSCKTDINYDTNVTEGVQDIDVDSFKIYRLLHPSIVEDDFNKRKGDKNTYYLFHGSRSENWYSIIRNGLKNCSKTELMTCGAAYGNGIYFSDDGNFSYSYGMSSKGESYLGVFEIIGHKNDYLKTPKIYVIDKENIAIQRYLIIAKKNCSKSLNVINNIFDKVIHQKKVNMIQGVMNKGVKKLIREYRLIKKIPQDKFGFRIEVNTDNVYLWKLFLFGYESKEVIAQDMAKYNIKEIEMQVSYPSNYPFSPPFVRIIKPRFRHLTGHVTREGALCMQILTEKHWDPACSMESLIITIKSEILAGGGQIDPQNYHIPYSEQLARESFVMVAKSHGWV